MEIGEEEHLEGPVLLRGADLCSALAASAAPHVSSAERAQLVRRLEAEEEAAEEEEEGEDEDEEGEDEGVESEALESAATPRASAAEHAQLVQRLEEHMAVHGLAQRQVASAAGISCQGKLSMWLGRCRGQTLRAASEADVDARVAAYLDRVPIPPAPTSTSAASAASNVSSAQHAQLVQRLKEHMATHGLTQVQVASAAGLSSAGKVCQWLGRSTHLLGAASMVKTDTRIAAYLDGAPIPPNPTSAGVGRLEVGLGGMLLQPRSRHPLGSATKAASARLASAKASRAEAAEGVPCPEMGPGWQSVSKKRPSPLVRRMGSLGSRQTNSFQTDHTFIAPDGP